MGIKKLKITLPHFQRNLNRWHLKRRGRCQTKSAIGQVHLPKYDDMFGTKTGGPPTKASILCDSVHALFLKLRTQWNLLSEELTVDQLDVVFTHDRDGKRIQFKDDHSVSWLHHSNGLQFVSPESSKRADAHIVGEVEQNVTDDVDQAREHQRTFVQDKFTQILDNVEVPPSDAFLQNYDVAYDHDLSLAEATLKSTVMSRTFEKLREILGFRSPPQVVKFANAAGMKLSDKDKKHSAAGLQGNAKLKPDVPGPTRQHHCGDKISQDPCRLPVIGFGGVTTVFFTSDAALGTVGVHATKDKSSMSAIESILEYIRQSNAYQRLGITRPKILKTDSEAIYTSETFLEWMRLGNSKTELSAPYHHRQNSQIERVIGDRVVQDNMHVRLQGALKEFRCRITLVAYITCRALTFLHSCQRVIHVCYLRV